MELRDRFNEDAISYDRYRPTYPDALFWDIMAYSGAKAGSKAVEIGVGTGQATKPFLEAGYKVCGVELGDRLSAFVSEKYRNYDNFDVYCGDYMEQSFEEASIDLIYSATAFHWLPQKEAYKKIRRELRGGGTLAVFRNHPYPNREDDETNAASRRIYDRLRPSEKKIVEFSENDCQLVVKDLRENGFREVESKLYRRVRTLSTEDYIGLLNTYSDHRALEIRLKEHFEEEMRAAINAVGGSIHIYDTIDLYLARNP